MNSPILTNAEAVQWLRLDDDYGHDTEAAVKALHRLARAGAIHPIRGCGKSLKWHVDELTRYAREAVTAGDSAAAPSASVHPTEGSALAIAASGTENTDSEAA